MTDMEWFWARATHRARLHRPARRAGTRMTRDALRDVRKLIRKQRSTPWSESGSFASRMTGEQGYDAAIEEVEALVSDIRSCTYRPVPRGEMCGRPELDSCHPLEDERMGSGKHIYRLEGRK